MEQLARIRRVQAVSGLLFAFFLCLHLATTASASFGAYDGVLRRLRGVYRPILLVELVLVGVPALVHIACALAVIAIRRRHRIRPAPALRMRVHRWAGYFLLLVVVGHVFATRIVPASGSGPADLSYLAFSVLGFPAFIDPYYLALGLAGSLHLFLGLPLALTIVAPKLLNARALARAGMVAAALAAIVVLAGVVSILRAAPRVDRARFEEYASLYDQWMPWFPHLDR